MFGLSSAEKFALEAARPRIRARRRLEKGVPDGDLYETVLEATGSEEAASAALTARIEERLRRGERPELF